MGENGNILDVRDLTVEFAVDEGVVRAVDRVSFFVRRGEVLGLVGESGCGKSVTALSVLRLIPSPPGRIVDGTAEFKGENLLGLPIQRLRSLRGREISMIFQEPMTALSPLHRVGRQLAEAQRLHSDVGVREARRHGREWLAKVGIADPDRAMDMYPFQLSGGMRQRVMIAMSLMLDPRLVIADEPTTALDVTIQAQVFDLMREMKRTETSLLLITHDMGVIWEMCERVVVMYASEMVETAPVAELFERPLHPYTEALLASVPSLEGSDSRLPAIEGSVPSPLEYPPGCRFNNRCPYVFDRCYREHPPLYRVQGCDGRCFLLDGETREGDAYRRQRGLTEATTSTKQA